jgi:CheY-like chemotaxis protein
MSPNHLNNLTILIVEDHDAVRRYLGNFLRRFGAVVVVATNASEGLQAVRMYRPALVLSDIAMPGRDGFGLLRDIRALGADNGGGVPAIAMSAFRSTHADRARLLNAGFQAFLPKPFGPDKLMGLF